MENIVIIYGSTTGNTETTAEILEKELSENGFRVDIFDVRDVSIDILKKDYDLFIFGCSTWGEDEIELQDDFEPFHDQMKRLPLNGKTTAVFGCGDSDYTFFCGAVDEIEETLLTQGASLATGSLKIDGDPVNSFPEIISWANSVMTATV